VPIPFLGLLTRIPFGHKPFALQNGEDSIPSPAVGCKNHHHQGFDLVVMLMALSEKTAAEPANDLDLACLQPLTLLGRPNRPHAEPAVVIHNGKSAFTPFFIVTFVSRAWRLTHLQTALIDSLDGAIDGHKRV
jgi:hypothetical protein